MTASKLSLIVSAALLFQSAAPAQSLGEPRGAAKTTASAAVPAERKPTPVTQEAGAADSLSSLVPREGLVLYVEMQGPVLQEMLDAGALMPFARKLLGDRSGKGTTDRVMLLGRNLAQAPDARVALAVYRTGAVAFIETANDLQAEYLKTELDKLRASDAAIVTKGRTVVAGNQKKMAAMQQEGWEGLSGDVRFMKAQDHFSDQPLIGFLQLGPGLSSLPQDASAGYAAGYLAGVAGVPSAVAFGGSREGDTFLIRAIRLDNPGNPAGSLSGIPASISGLFSGVLLDASEPADGAPAEGFVPADSDVFLDLKIDWYRLYDGLSAIVEKFATSMSGQGNGNTSVDLLPTLEAKLGFSIRNDLLPTLGNEVAISISGFDRLFEPKAASSQATAPAPTPPRANPSPRFMLVLALKDPAGFEKLLNKLLASPSGSSAQLPRTLYRGASIAHSKGIAYTIVDGFLVVSGGVGDIRRALDARAAGTSLATQARYRSVIPESPPAMLRAYLGSSFTSKLLEGLGKESAFKPEPRSTANARRRSAEPIGLVVLREGEETVIELRMPVALVSSIVAAVSNLQPNQLSGDVGIPEASGPRSGGGRRSPSLTTEDIRRRP